jgi:hypothetical protein
MADLITPGFIPVIQGENPKRKKAPLGANDIGGKRWI